MLPDLTAEQTRHFLSHVLEIHELVRGYAKKKDRAEVLSFLAVAAANHLLFAAQRMGRIVAMSIGGPTNKPDGLHNFSIEGRKLFCFYALIDPLYRRPGLFSPLLTEMEHAAGRTYPWCERLCWYTRGHYFERDVNRGEEWAAAPPLDTSMARARPWLNSRSPMRGPSEA